MNKRIIALTVSGAILLFGIIGIASSEPQPQGSTESTVLNTNAATKEVKETPKPTCDGTTITSNCVVDTINYVSYTYVPAVPEKSHTETITTYREEIANYCTLCNDGTYSPSCATGRGACSHHDGVAQWNAPRYRSVPVYTTKVVIDSPAQEAYYTKVTE